MIYVHDFLSFKGKFVGNYKFVKLQYYSEVTDYANSIEPTPTWVVQLFFFTVAGFHFSRFLLLDVTVAEAGLTNLGSLFWHFEVEEKT